MYISTYMCIYIYMWMCSCVSRGFKRRGGESHSFPKDAGMPQFGSMVGRVAESLLHDGMSFRSLTK